jgi:hypothetical protein
MTVTPAKLTVPQLVEKFPDYFMELEISLLHSQAPCPYPESDQSGSCITIPLFEDNNAAF